MKLKNINVRLKPSNERRISPEILEKYFEVNFIIDEFINEGLKVEVKSVLDKHSFSEVTYYNIRNFFKNSGVIVINQSDVSQIKGDSKKYKYLNELIKLKKI